MQEVDELPHDLTIEKPRKRKTDALELVDQRYRTLHLLFGALLIGGVFVYLQFSTKAICCGDFDGYYHIRWSSLLWDGIRHRHFPPTFVWLPLTTLNPHDYVDHHLLFHIFQIPFTWSGNLRIGAKVSAALFASLAVFSCFALIVKYRIRYSLVWLLALLACSAPFLYRMNMAKAPPFAIIYMVIGISVLFEKKYWVLLPLTLLFALTYDLFVLLPIAVVIWVSILYWAGDRFEWRPLLWVGLGVLAGFVVNPYFPRNVMLFYEHAMMKLNPAGFKTDVGQEWYPYESWYFLISCFVAFSSMVAGYIAFNWSERRNAIRPLFFLIFSTLLMVINFNWRRFVEYWPPFAVMFAAFSLQPLLDGVASYAAKLPSHVMEDLEPFLDRHTGPQSVTERRKELWAESEIALVGAAFAIVLFFVIRNGPSIRVIDQTTHAVTYNRTMLWWCIGAVAIYLLLIVLYFLRRKGMQAMGAMGVSLICLVLLGNAVQTASSIRETEKPDYYKGGMDWIRANVPAGERVFNTDWDDFPRLFYYDTSHNYISGLDPTYLLDQNPDLSKLYVDITLGKEKESGPLIRDRFGAHYVFTDNEKVHDDFVNNALDSGWFEQVYEDDDCSVLKLRETKGEPPTDDSDEPSDDSEPDPEQK